MSYETAVDVNGAPWARAPADVIALDRQPDRHLTVFRDKWLTVLDDAGAVLATRATVGLSDTDVHDAVLEPDGTLWIAAQRADPDGTAGFQWSSPPYVRRHGRDASRRS